MLYGPLGGAIAGGLAGFTTFLLWNHPWAWIGMTLEGTLVGLLSRRFRPLRAVALYWVAGIPLVIAAYVWGEDVPFRDAALVAVKQCANSLRDVARQRASHRAADRPTGGKYTSRRPCRA